MRKAEVTLPQGMGLNPSGAQGLVACTDAQFKKGVRTYTNECPAASDIGTVEVDSPPLAEPLIGDVYVGEQKSSDPESGELFRILLEAKSEHEGIAARLVGHVKANKTTGQLTAVLDDQLTGAVRRQTAGRACRRCRSNRSGSTSTASKDVLTSPPTCSARRPRASSNRGHGPGRTKPVSRHGHPDQRPERRRLPETMAERKFAPSYKANIGQHQRRRLQPVPRPHRARRRPAGAEGGRRHPAEGADRQARRHPLLLGGGDRRGRRQAAARPSRPIRAARPTA